MKFKCHAIFLSGLSLLWTVVLSAQTVYIPGGTASGIGSISGSNVGIGTTVPLETLHVNGAVQISNQTTGYASTANALTLDYVPGSGVSRVLSFGPDAATFGKIGFYSAKANNGSGYYPMFIDSTGNVGVGNTTPNALVDITNYYYPGKDSFRFSYYDTAYSKWYWMGVQPYVVGAGDVGYRFRTTNDTATTDAFAITGYGMVGIGTLNPSNDQGWNRVLEVKGGPHAKLLVSEGAAGVKVGLFSHSTWWTGGVGKIGTESAHPLALMAGYGNDVMTLQTTGKVGIGTTAPIAKLQMSDYSAGGVYQEMLDLQVAYSPNSAQKALTWRDSSGVTGQIDTRYDGTYVNMVFGHLYSSGYQTSDLMMIKGNGNVGIGTTNPTQKLSVNGTIRAKEVVVDTGWSDYVFDDSYRLAPLSEVEQRIKADKHLPGLPSAQEVAEHGVTLGDMQSKLLAKIEELTLHQIEQEKLLRAQAAEIADLRAQVSHRSVNHSLP